MPLWQIVVWGLIAAVVTFCCPIIPTVRHIVKMHRKGF